MNDSGPLKLDSQKNRLELVPVELIEGCGRGVTYGASNKYTAGNWAQPPGFNWSRLYGALQRHLTAFWGGEDIDEESQLHHLDLAACELGFLMAHKDRKLGKDDRKDVGAYSE